MRITLHARALCAVAVIAALAAIQPPTTRASNPKPARPYASPNAEEQELAPNELRQLPSPIGGYLLYDDNGRIGCRLARPDEMPLSYRSIDASELKPITPPKANRGGQPGFDLVLLGTAQLDNFPEAKAAYARAEATWESLISTPITVVVRVDFGPTNFGEPYGPGILGSTDPQFSLDEGFISLRSYATTRSRLIERSDSAAETAILNALPTGSVPTTASPCDTIVISTAMQRALGFLSPTADQNASYLPTVGLNSAFPYDFDPSNGIDSNKQDFNATALHEIGHALGFNSWTGILELAPSFPAILSTWDLYRFRSGVNTGTFGTAQRVLASGGEQIFFNGSDTFRLSTGRPDGNGGDGNQASHWKDNVQNGGVYIGIMDPTGADGDLDEITEADLIALDFMGYAIRRGPSLSDVEGSLSGNTLSVSGVAVSPFAAGTQLKLTLLNSAGTALGSLPTVAVNIPVGTTQNISVDFTGLENFLAATQADLTLVDANSSEGAAARINFGAGDSGAPTVSNVTFPKGKKLKFTGAGFTGATIEVNGVVVTPPLTFKVKGGGTKGTLKGNASQLGLQSGPNRIRVFIGNIKSSIFVLNV